MKTVLITLASGIFVALFTSTGIKEDIQLIKENYETLDVYVDDNNFELENDNYNNYLEELFQNLEDEETLKIEEIEVIEIEEEFDLGINTKEYLPLNFNPYKGINTKEELEVESQIALDALICKVEYQDIIKIEEIEVIEIEEEVDLGINTKDYLPLDFNPFKGMNTKEELGVESQIALEALIGKVDYQDIIKVEDIIVIEIEEEVKLGFNTKDYLPKDFNPYQGLSFKEAPMALKNSVTL